jgi:hypothetical protein
VAVIALIAAMSGSAFAASQITGSQIKDGTIGVKDLSKKAVAALHGARGQRGRDGTDGERGRQGQKGDTGPSDAFSFFHDADITLPNSSTPVSAPLAAGRYVILAKFVFDNDSNFTSRPTCTLTAGTDPPARGRRP